MSGSPDPGNPPAGFSGNDRFRIIRRLGQGGFGVVYEAFDNKSRGLVALKVLNRVEPAWVYRFKQEFRVLQGITHANLAALYELLSEERTWLLTMELIDGVHFLDYLRGAARPDGAEAQTATLTPADQPGNETTLLAGPVGEVPARTDFTRLRDAFRQLTLGIAAIHGAGKVHRDIKPSNVLVESDGRVVILDFGLTIDSEAAPRGEIAGTPKYMSPEQRAGASGPASDWYAMGVMLYESLTGSSPSAGASAVPPAEINPKVPRRLSELCVSLLDGNPSRRPSQAEILAELGAAEQASAPLKSIFVGRSAELAQLRDALEMSLRRGAVTVRVQGESGIGKSTLVKQFLEGAVVAHPTAVVLSGRCYDRESVAYKALDGIADQLSQLLHNMSPEESARVLPRNTYALARLFPVMGRVRAVSEAPAPLRAATEPGELRRHGALALRELLSRLAAYYPLLLHIDDLQWGDMESASLIETILRTPDAPPLLLLASHRADEAKSNRPLQALVAAMDAGGPAVEIRLESLGPEEARELTEVSGGSDAERIFLESRGNPFLIGAMLRHGAAAFSSAGSGTRSPMEAFMAREVARLPEGARGLLEVVSVAARPMRVDVLASIPGLDTGPGAVNQLRSERLLRTRYVDGCEEVESYHDRIREGLVAVLAEGRRRDCHVVLAEALAKAGDEALGDAAMHFAAAGHSGPAAELAEPAAALAFEALAFERAAMLYRLALAGDRTLDRAHLHKLRLRYAESVMHSGQNLEAAKAWELASRSAPDGELIECLRNAAELYISAGHFKTGRNLLTSVLAASGLSMPGRPLWAVLRFVVRRVRLKLRGLQFKPRDPATLEPARLARVDACCTAALSFAAFDAVGTFEFQSRHTLEALELGDPVRVSRALCYDAALIAAAGTLTRKALEPEIALAERLIAEINDPTAGHVYRCAMACFHLWNGEWKRAVELATLIEASPQAGGKQWPVGNSFIAMMHTIGMLLTGDLNALRSRVTEEIRRATEREDLWLGVFMYTPMMPTLRLASDEPRLALRELRTALARWPEGDFFVPHFWGTFAEVNIHLYEGDAEAAWAAITRTEASYRQARLADVEHVRILEVHARGRIAVMRGGRHLRDARKCASRLSREKAGWARGLELALRGAIANVEGNRDAARELLRQADAELGASDMRLFQAAVRHTISAVTGDSGPGERAVAYFSTHKVVQPGKMARAFAPVGPCVP